MLRRCYSEKVLLKQPSYVGCSVDKSWHNYQVFAEWYNKNYIEKFELDKDLLVKGNKVYSKDTCVFIPHCLNSFMANNKSNNKSGYVGVNWHSQNGKWLVRIRDCMTSKSISLGCHISLEKASLIYIKARTAMAHRMKHRMILDYGITDLRILDAIDKEYS